MKRAEKEQLQNLTLHATEISDAMTYFLDHFAEDDAFLSGGERCDTSELQPILAGALRTVVGDSVKITGLLPVRIVGEAFVHGGFGVNGQMAMFFYFESLRTGVIGLTDRSGKSHFIRFRTSAPIPTPSKN